VSRATCSEQAGGSLGGGGARERGLARLGNTRGAVVLVRAFVRLERQRGGVGCLGLCPERGQGERGRVYPRG
jgi:hypothetical protein